MRVAMGSSERSNEGKGEMSEDCGEGREEGRGEE